MKGTTRWSCAHLAFVALPLLASGCLVSSSETRNQTFAPFEGVRVADEAIQPYLRSRTALVVVDPSVTISNLAEISKLYTFKSALSNRFAVAAAVDHRGYFLTRSHESYALPPYSRILIYESTNAVRIERADLVWQHGHLALLHAPTSVENTFDWTDQYGLRDYLLTIGPNQETNTLDWDFMAVQVRDIIRWKGQPQEIIIEYKGLQQPGDKGAPLVTVDGGLVGITIGGEVFLSLLPLPHFVKVVYAARPEDLEGLRSIIDEHASRIRNDPPAALHGQ